MLRAHQQVDPRNRRVTHQVVAPEDHPAAQFLVEDVASVDLLEVDRQQFGRNRFDGPRVVRCGARLVQCKVVDVGGVDLHPLPERLEAERFGQQNGERVRLLPGGAACAPHPDRVLGPALGEDRRDHLVLDRLPGFGVTEECRHIDQDRVEERREFVGTRLQHIEILIECRVAGVIHAVLDPPHQRRALVAGEVESARVPQIAQQSLKGVVGTGVHGVLSVGHAMPGTLLVATARSPGPRPPTRSCPRGWAGCPTRGSTRSPPPGRTPDWCRAWRPLCAVPAPNCCPRRRR